MLRSLLVSAGVFVALGIAACGTSDSSGFGGENNGDLDGSRPPFDFGDGGGDAIPGCKNLECKQVNCPGGTDTTVTGTVFAPNGTLPIYNAIVYVPNGTVQPQTKGVTCDKCGTVASGSPLVTALTDSSGKFTLKKVPIGQNIPLVIQLGKWRRQVVIPEVVKCTENRLTDPNMTRFPKNQTEGDMPKIAITTGGCDQLGCMLPKLGIDKNEFGVEGDGDAKAVHIYQSNGTGLAGSTSAKSFWSDVNKLKKYDVSVLSCECSESPGSKDALSFKSVTDYLSLGGRIFTTDFQYTWYKQSPDPNLAGISNITGGAPFVSTPMYLDDSFPKGKALADWLKVNFPASTYGEVPAGAVFDNFKNPVDKTKTQIWATGASGGKTGDTRVFTVNTPVGSKPEDQCGKAVHIDAHVNSVDQFPNSCGTPLGQAEAMFAFFFFDLSSCIQKDDKEPLPPVK